MRKTRGPAPDPTGAGRTRRGSPRPVRRRPRQSVSEAAVTISPRRTRQAPTAALVKAAKLLREGQDRLPTDALGKQEHASPGPSLLTVVTASTAARGRTRAAARGTRSADGRARKARRGEGGLHPRTLSGDTRMTQTQPRTPRGSQPEMRTLRTKRLWGPAAGGAFELGHEQRNHQRKRR